VQMAGSQTGPEVWGFTNAPGELVTVTIDHASSTYRGYGRSRLEDSFFHIDVGLTIVASDTVTAQWAGGSRSLTVPDLSATVNPETGHVGGRAPAGARVEVRGWGVETAADDNTYSIWAGVSMAGAQRDVMITDLDSLDRVWLRAVAPIVYIHRGHDEVWGYARFADANVEVTIVPASHIPQPQLVNTTSDRGSGYFYVRTGSALVSGDVVQVMVSDEVDEVTVVDLGAAADAAAEVVSGVGPVGAELHVSVPEGRRTVVADGSGAFTADFANQHLPGDWTWPINIRPGDVGDVQYVDANGNVIYARFNAPLLRAHVTNDTVKGYATPGFSIVVTLRDSSGALKSAVSTISDETGRYFVHFESEDIVAGDAISVEVGGASQFAMTVDDLAIQPLIR
jgi:hypothetical protein